MDAMKEMKVAFDFLLTKKINIKSIIKKHDNINEVMEIVCDIFNDEYLSMYPIIIIYSMQ